MSLLKHILLISAMPILPTLYTAAQSVPPADVASGVVYTQEDFVKYGPRTARDMVSRIPGFTIEQEDDESRGFGQASGNVLINGQRISGKSNGAEDALERIPAASVERIEIVEGANLGIPGLSGQVANVVAKANEGVSGTWGWSTRVRENLPPWYDRFNLSLSGAKGALNWTLEAKSEPERSASGGPERLRDPAGDLLERRNDDFTRISAVPSLAGSLNWTPANGHIANLNAKYGLYQQDVKEVSKRFPAAGPEARRLFQRSEDEWNGEIGGDYELGFGPGRLKAIGLVRRENSPFRNEVLFATLDGSKRNQSVFEQEIDEGEYILRSEYAWAPRQGIDWQVSAEGAFNYLESEAQLFTAMGSQPLTEQVLANSNSRVEEQRGEISVTHGRQVTPKLNLKMTLGAERSELSQTGAAGQTRKFTRPKGNLIATYQASDKLTLTTRIEREVGQLDFFDFISSVNLEDDRDRTGNPSIVPEQKWVLGLTAERDYGRWGAATLSLSAEDIEDIVDRIPIGTGDGPGNIDSAWRFGAELTATLKFDPLGLKGAELEVQAEAYESEVDDPLTGRARWINGDQVTYFFTRFRHDVPQTNWGYGVGFEVYREAAHFTLSEISHYSSNPGFGFAFVQHKDLMGMTGTFTLGNIVNQRDKSDRQFFDTNRLGALTAYEETDRKFGPILTFELEGTF